VRNRIVFSLQIATSEATIPPHAVPSIKMEKVICLMAHMGGEERRGEERRGEGWV